MDAWISGFLIGAGLASLAWLGCWQAWMARIADAVGAL